MPWLVFSLIVCLYAFAYGDFGPLVWALVAASALLALLFISMGGASGKVAQLALGFLVLTSVGVAVPVGLFVESTYMEEYWRLDSGAEYSHVNPAVPGASYGDASALVFEKGSFVDTEHSLGFMRLGKVFCVAPVLGPGVPGAGAAAAAQYWAAGTNCCNHRGAFVCNDVEDPIAHSGVVASDVDGSYWTAVRMASAVYELPTPTSTPVFLRWTSDTTKFKDKLWTGALTLSAVASSSHLLGSTVAGLMLSRGLLR